LKRHFIRFRPSETYPSARGERTKTKGIFCKPA
jgi:hypothetical protein